jgi:hypothetical protein
LRLELKDVEEQLSDTFLPVAKDVLRAPTVKTLVLRRSQRATKGSRSLWARRSSWDQDKLRDALNAMSPEDAQHYGKLTFAVEERKFTAAPPAIREVSLKSAAQ